MKFVNFINNAQNLLKVLQHLFQKKKKKKKTQTRILNLLFLDFKQAPCTHTRGLKILPRTNILPEKIQDNYLLWHNFKYRIVVKNCVIKYKIGQMNPNLLSYLSYFISYFTNKNMQYVYQFNSNIIFSLLLFNFLK